ncbi:MAG: DUF1439 domain-containing protein [Bacteroidota bacterium]
MKSKCAVLLFAALATCATAGFAALLDHEVTFSQDQIQHALAKSGPQTKNYGGLISVTLAEAPQITLGEPAGRVGIAGHVDITLLGNPPVPVDVTATAGIRYDDNAKAFFLENPVVESIESQALPKESAPAARRTVNALITAYFRSKPVYTLRENGNAQELAARWLLRSVRVEPGKVVATLSPF